MRDNSRHSPHRGESFRSAKGFLGLQSRSDVPANLQNDAWLISIGLKNLAAGNDDLASILCILNQVSFPSLSLRDHRLYLLIGHGKLRVQQLVKVLPESLFGAPTIQRSSTRIPELNGPVQVTHHDGFRSKIQQVCTLPQYLLHLLSLGDIDERSDRAPNVPGVIEKWIRAHQGLNHISARGADFELDS